MTSSTDVRDLRADLLWRMLATLGAPVAARPFKTTAIDPECTLVLSCIHAMDDARAAELALWFGSAANRVLTATRTKRIARELGEQGKVALDDFAATAREVGVADLRVWSKRLAPSSGEQWRIAYDPARLAERIGGERSIAPALMQPGAFRIRVRLALGPGVRAEALAMLMVESKFWSGRGEGWLTIPQLQVGTGFDKHFLRECLLDMAASGIVTHQRVGRAHEFAANPDLGKTVGSVPTMWGNWSGRIAALLAIEQSLLEVERTPTITVALEQVRALSSVTALAKHFETPSNPDDVVRVFEHWCVNVARWLVDVA